MTYDTTHGEGRRIWHDCLDRAAALRPSIVSGAPASEPAGNRWGAPQLVTPRLGQGTFRYAVEATYGQCAVTREHSLPALEAAHIVPCAENGVHDIPNSLLLRADLHKLFDRGYVTVAPDQPFRVSPRLDRDFHNGRICHALEGREIARPGLTTPDPSNTLARDAGALPPVPGCRHSRHCRSPRKETSEAGICESRGRFPAMQRGLDR